MAVDAAVSMILKYLLELTDDKLSFIETYKKRLDFDQIWLDLCRDDPGSKAVIRSYFRDFVETSQTVRPVLGEEEYEVVQTITTTQTVITQWKTLVAEADNTILRLKRKSDPDNDALWKLRWAKGDSPDGPVADISNVSRISSI
jgi:hypothetical protein